MHVMTEISRNHFISIVNVVSLVVVIVARFVVLLHSSVLTTNQDFYTQMLQYSCLYLCVRVFVCFIFKIYYTYSLPSRTARRTQRNITHAMQHSTAHAQTHTQSTYRKTSAIVQFKKRTRFPFTCQLRFSVSSSNGSKRCSKKVPRNNPDTTQHSTTHQHTTQRTPAIRLTYEQTCSFKRILDIYVQVLYLRTVHLLQLVHPTACAVLVAKNI